MNISCFNLYDINHVNNNLHSYIFLSNINSLYFILKLCYILANTCTVDIDINVPYNVNATIQIALNANQNNFFLL